MSELMTLAELGGPLALLGGAVYTRKAHPSVYWATVGLPSSVVRLVGSYSSTMDACGLTVQPSRLRALAVRATTRREVRSVPPRRGLIRPTSTGLRVRLRLAPGQEPADVAASSERLRHAWGVHAVHVREIKPGVVELRRRTVCTRARARRSGRAVAGSLRVRGSPSEPLREDQGEDEIAQQGDGHDQADDVLGGHSFVTALATRATSANDTIVVTTKARSAIVNSWNEVRKKADG